MDDHDLEDVLDANLRSLGTVERSSAIDDEVGLLVDRIADPDERHTVETELSVPQTNTRRSAATKWGIGLIAGALVIAGGAVPATAFMDWIARTGENAGTGTEDHGSELIDLTASDIRGLVDEMYPQSIPLPGSFTRAEAVGSVQAALQSDVDDPVSNPDGRRVLMEELGITRQFESFALCAWLWEWRQADREGDIPTRDGAATHIRDAANWPAIVETDGGGVTDGILATADAADRGNSTSVSRTFGLQGCSVLLGDTRAIRGSE